MSKKTGIVFVIFGAVLILSALLLYFHNTAEDQKAGQISADILDSIKAEIVTKTDTDEVTSETDRGADDRNDAVTDKSEEMPVVDVNGYSYIGYIAIPKMGVELPVMDDWSYMKLDMAPCRHFGSTATDDLVIAAHNYTSHFAGLEVLQPGDAVSITKMDGEVIHYTVAEQRIVDGKAVDEVLNSGFDLVLYTCTYEGTTRIAIFCNRT